MALQKQVNKSFAVGVPGMPVNPQMVSTPINKIAEDEKVTVGNFCFEGTDAYTQVKGAGTKVAGFVIRVVEHANRDLNSGATLVVNKEDNVAVAKKGSFYAVSAEKMEAGDAVKAGTNGAVAKATGVATDFVVVKGGEIGELIVISNW